MQKDMQRGFSTFSKVTAQVNVVKDSNMENTKKVLFDSLSNEKFSGNVKRIVRSFFKSQKESS